MTNNNVSNNNNSILYGLLNSEFFFPELDTLNKFCAEFFDGDYTKSAEASIGESEKNSTGVLDQQTISLNDQTDFREKRAHEPDIETHSPQKKQKKKPKATKTKTSKNYSKSLEHRAREACLNSLKAGCIPKTPSADKGELYCKIYKTYQEAVLKVIKKIDLDKLKYERRIQKFLEEPKLLKKETRDKINTNDEIKKHLIDFLGITSSKSSFPYGEQHSWMIGAVPPDGISNFQKGIKERIQLIFNSLPLQSVIDSINEKKT
jgi:hypothetical protein